MRTSVSVPLSHSLTVGVGPESDDGRNAQRAKSASLLDQYDLEHRTVSQTRSEEDALELAMRESLRARESLLALECIEPVGQEYPGADFSLCSSHYVHFVLCVSQP